MPAVVKGNISRFVAFGVGNVRVQHVEGVTADGTWTADTLCVTADGRIVCIPVDVVEATTALDEFDATAIAGGAVIDADVFEAAAAVDETDAAVGANVLFGSTDEAADALDALDAVVVPLSVVDGGGGRYYPPLQRPFPIVGHGYGILPQLEGEAHGTVGDAPADEGDDWPDDVELMLMMLAA